ncbi:MAG: alpha/beta fold hydrolase [Steroidobacteraceae bacterium]
MRIHIAGLLASCCLTVQAGPIPEVDPGTLIEAPGPAGPLQGTLQGPLPVRGPVVLMIPGSGPTNRDGDNRQGLRAATYRLLARGLAAHGVTTVRIDKRGMFGSSAAVPDGNAVTIEDYVADVRSWTTVIRQRTGASCIWLLGHSEGGLVAMAAAQKEPDVCGLLLIAAAGRPMGEVLREQLTAHPAYPSMASEAGAVIDALQAGKRVDVALMQPPLQRLFAPQVQGFLISAFSYDPAQLLRGYAKPVLILQGQRDIQVPEADARLLRQADPKATLMLLPDVNHVLKSVASDDRKTNAATYTDPDLPLAPGVVDSIAGFLSTSANP